MHVVVAVDEDRGLTGRVKPVGVDQRMELGIDKPCVFHADALEVGEQRLGSLAAIGFVLRQCGDRWNAQQSLQIIKKTGIVLARKFNGGEDMKSLPSKIGQLRV